MTLQVESKLGIYPETGKEYWLDKTGKLCWRIPDLRECVRAQPGYKILCADYSQIEVKLMAYYSQDSFLLDAINSGKDIHSYMACDVLGYDYDYFIQVLDGLVDKHLKDEYKLERASIKTVTFGIPYGAGINKIALMIQKKDKRGRPLETIEAAEARAASIIEKYFKKAWKLKLWLDSVRQGAVENLYTVSPSGRRRRFADPDRNSRFYNKHIGQIHRWAGNAPIQSGNVDLLKPALYNIWIALRNGDPTAAASPEGASILLAVHDEIVMQCREKDVETISVLMRSAMLKAYDDIWRTNSDGTVIRLADIKNDLKVVDDFYWSKD